jgi:hypothetical protein
MMNPSYLISTVEARSESLVVAIRNIASIGQENDTTRGSIKEFVLVR